MEVKHFYDELYWTPKLYVFRFVNLIILLLD